MRIDAQEYLDLVEEANQLLFFDIESTGFNADYGACLVFSSLGYKDANAESVTARRTNPGHDKTAVIYAKETLESAGCWVSYYGKGFDIKFLNSRCLRWGLEPIRKRPHLDLYWVFKSQLATSRKSLAHMLEWLEIPEKKMSLGADTWASQDIEKLIERCESDCTTLRELYERTRHLVIDITR